MTSTALYVLPTSSPGDVSSLSMIGDHSPEDVLAVVGKTEGNGCVNDFSRTLSSAAWDPLIPSTAVTVFSGGTEGVLSPHVNVFVRDIEAHEGQSRGLIAGAGRSRTIQPAELGKPAQLDAVSEAVTALMAEHGVTADDVHLVLVKCPLLTSEKIAALHARGESPITTDTYDSMSRSRAASALGIAVALGEATRGDAIEALTGRRDDIWSARASASSGAELEDCHILLIAESPSVANPLRATHTAMSDAIDLPALTAALGKIESQGGTVRQVFAKAEADPTGTIRGRRHTMLTDSDINSTRHARAAVGGLIAALVGDAAIYVSGGAEHQGPPGGGSVTIVYEVPPAETNEDVPA